MDNRYDDDYNFGDVVVDALCHLNFVNYIGGFWSECGV